MALIFDNLKTSVTITRKSTILEILTQKIVFEIFNIELNFIVELYLKGVNFMIIQPLFDRVILKQIESKPNKSAGGLVLPKTTQEKPLIAEVVGVGDGYTSDGKTIDMVVSVGDKVVYSKYAGINFKIDGEEVVLIRQSDILAKIND